MAGEAKTKSAPLDREVWLAGVDPARRKEAERLLAIFGDVTGWEPRLWGPSMVGFGRYVYRYDSGHGGESLATGFSPRKAELTIYILPGHADFGGILAMSGGVPPALQLASLAPERIVGMALLSSAPFTPLTAATQDLPMPAWAYRALFSSDFPIWAIVRSAPGLLDPVFDVTPALRSRLAPEDAAIVTELVNGFLPVTDRLPGLANEGAAIDPAATYPLDRITTPTLIVHARDDGINPFPIAEYLANSLPKARFLPLPEGGHLLLGHKADVIEAVADILGP